MNNLNQSNSKKKSNEEVDLVVFFNLIGNAISRVFAFITLFLKSIFSLIISILKIFVVNWKLILGVLVLSFTAGYFIEKTKRSVYSSEMLVEPYYNSKYQLVTNVNYYNALIDSEDYKTLESIFNTDTTKVDVKEIKSFKVEPGPETENDRILQYQEFMQKLDSVRKEEITFNDYIENRSIYSGNFFLITAESYKKDIFKDLETGVNSAFTNNYSKEEFRKKDRLIEIQKQNLEDQLKEIDSLKDVYIKVIEKESQSNSSSLSFGETSFSLQKDKPETREFDLLDKAIDLKNELRALEERRVEEDAVFDVISSFQKVGNPVTSLREKYSIIFPALAFIILAIFFLAKKIIMYVNNYED